MFCEALVNNWCVFITSLADLGSALSRQNFSKVPDTRQEHFWLNKFVCAQPCMHVMALFPSFKETTNKCPHMLKLKPVTLSLPNLLCSKAMGIAFYSMFFWCWISNEVVYLQHWHGWCHKKLLPSRRILCTPYNHAPCHFMQSHICKVYACLAVTCHLCFCKNDRGLLCATAVTQGWNGYRNKSQHRKLTLEKKILLPLQQGFEPETLRSRVWCSNHWVIPAPMWQEHRESAQE